MKKSHPEIGKSTRIALALQGKPYDSVSIDTFSIGQVRLTREAKNILRKNILLAVSCLNCGHLSIESISNLTPHSIGSALWRIEERYATRIQKIYSYNYTSLRESSLGPEFEDMKRLRVSIEGVVSEEDNLEFFTNPSYTKCWNWVERKIKDIRKTIETFSVIQKRIVLGWEENANLFSAI